ncbi:MAG: 2-hydroxyacid dehydrogenase [Haloferacaceae archaeon]
MHVVVADRQPAFEVMDDPFGDAVRSAGGTIRYEDCGTEVEVIQQCSDAEVLVVFKAPITPRVARNLPETRLIVRVGTGYDNVNVKAATENDIMVSNTPGYSRHQVATHAITLMLAAAREVVDADRQLRTTGGWGNRGQNRQIHGETVGIVGLGRIGRAVVPKARGFDADVIAFDPYVPEDVFEALDVHKVTFDELLASADFVTVHTPLTAETRHLFSTPEFERMRDDAVFVNVSRGPIVDTEALAQAVETGGIWAAGLDVFEREPPEDSPVFDSDRIVCSPHRAGRTAQSRERKLELTREVLASAVAGDHPEYLVNPEVLQYTDSQLNPEYHEWNEE